jgi:hypothetical protein
MKLTYVGPKLSTGEPERSLIFDGIPAGDLDDRNLTKAQLKTVLGSGLYAWATPPSKRAKATKLAKAQPATETNDQPAGDAPEHDGEGA